MGELILSMLPYALAAAAAAPIVAVVSAVILAESRRPLLSAWVFTAGAAGLVLIFSIALLAVAAASDVDEGSDVGAIVDLVLGIAFLALGLIAVLSKPDTEKEAAQQQRIRQAAQGGLRIMLVTGVVAQVINMDALAVYVGALKEVALADESIAASTVAVLVTLTVMLLPYYAPAVAYAVSPEHSGGQLRRMSEWLLGHSRALEIVVGLGFGAIFLIKGVSAI